LKAWWDRASQGSNQFKQINGLLCYKAPPGGLTTQDYVLVLPKAFQGQVIKTAHDTVFGAHMGQKGLPKGLLTNSISPKCVKKWPNTSSPVTNVN